MASTWGSSWSTSWGNSWGSVDTLVGKRIRRRRRIGWKDPEFVRRQQEIISAPPPLNVEAEEAAWRAISARINRIEELRTAIETAQSRTKQIRKLERELALLESEDEDELLLLS